METRLTTRSEVLVTPSARTFEAGARLMLSAATRVATMSIRRLLMKLLFFMVLSFLTQAFVSKPDRDQAANSKLLPNSFVFLLCHEAQVLKVIYRPPPSLCDA